MAAIASYIKPAESEQIDYRSNLAAPKPVKLLDQKNPEYLEKMETWIALSLLYEGGHALRKNAEKVLKKRPREDSDMYAARMDKFTYQNILGTALGWYNSSIFNTDVLITINNKKDQQISEEAAKPYNEFIKNCNGNGKEFLDESKKAFTTILVFGSAWILTDLRTSRSPVKESPRTLYEQKAFGLLDPRISVFTPLDVINWQCAPNGELEWVVVKTSEVSQEFLGPRILVDRWYYYDRENYYVYEDRRPEEKSLTNPSTGGQRMALFVAEGRHALANERRVPIRRHCISEGLWLANRSFLLLLDHMNQDNTLSWSLFMSNLAMPVIIGDVDATNMTYHEAGFLQFPAGTTYSWTEPAGHSFQHSASRLQDLREEAFRNMYLTGQGRSMRATPAMQSGRSKELDLEPAKDVKQSMGNDVRTMMRETLVDVVSASGDTEKYIPNVSGFIYKDEMTTEEVFAVTSVLGLQIPSPTFERIIYKKVMAAWTPGATRTERDAMNKEAETGPLMAERLEEQMRTQAEISQKAVTSAANKVPSGPTKPPGRGGGGPSPRPK